MKTKKMYPSMRYKPVKPGGWINHVQFALACILIFPCSINLAVLFGEQIDEFFSVWERQFIFAMALLVLVSILFAVRFWRNL